MNENQLTIVREYEFDKPEVREIEKILDDIIKDCRNKYFHTFEYRLVYDNHFTKISNIEEVSFTITQKSMELKIEFFRLIKKIKNARRNGFMFN